MRIPGVIIILAAGLVPVAGHVSAADTVLSRLAGWWDEGVDHYSLCAEGRPQHRIVHDPKEKTLTFEYDKPVKRYDGQESRTARYQIVGVSATTVTLKLENETRRTPEGAIVQWEFDLVDPETYRWHASHKPVGEYNNVVGRRCTR